MARAILDVPDISCEHCERTVRETLRPLQGVLAVTVDIPGRAVAVDYDEAAIDVARMSEALAGEEYPVASSRPG
jgi:copper chaperone